MSGDRISDSTLPARELQFAKTTGGERASTAVLETKIGVDYGTMSLPTKAVEVCMPTNSRLRPPIELIATPPQLIVS